MASTHPSKKPDSPLAIPGEKQIKPTPESDPLNPVDISDEAKSPLPDRAVDRRTNIEPGGPIGDGVS